MHDGGREVDCSGPQGRRNCTYAATGRTLSACPSIATSILDMASSHMPRLVVRLFSGLFVTAQLALCSAGVLTDAKQELAVLTADVHVESQAESCIPQHDHRLCVLGRSGQGIVVPQATIPSAPVFTADATRLQDVRVAADATPRDQPPSRGPPSFT